MNEGGIIGKQNITTSTSTSGMWKLNEVLLKNTVYNEWPNLNAPSSVSYWVIGGGGSGGHGPYAGGGSGQIPQQGTWAPAGGITYAVTIGAGGAGGSNSSSHGANSSISSVVSAAGGQYPLSPLPGQSSPNRDGAPNQLYIGGTSDMGGGAGAGGNGGNGRNWTYGGDGGPGVTVPISPTSLTIGGGGGGGSDYGYNRYGSGTDGGGNGGYSNGIPNTGGGGGSMGDASGYAASGGSGRVILRYADIFPAATATTGTVTVTVSGGYRHYDFTTSGSITF